MVEYWVWLQQVLGLGSRTIHNVIREYTNAYNFYKAPANEKIIKAKLSKKQAERLNRIPRKTVMNIVDECNNSGIKIITPDNELYPKRLFHIPNPPAALYVKGNMPKLDEEVVITIVGPRNPTDYGMDKTFEISKALTRGGSVIVSGGAKGIDTAALSGSLAENGVCIAVLGCGINCDYLRVNAGLRKGICKNGCLISEYPPQYKASRTTFPVRNRLMAALSLGVIVAEAPEKSGSLITANYAADYGKDVFVIPGLPDDKYYIGSNNLLRDGAKALIEPIDVLEEYVELYPHKINLQEAYNISDNSSFEDYFSEYSVIADMPFTDIKRIDKREQAKYVKRFDVSKLSLDAQKIYESANEEFTSDEMVYALNKNIMDIQVALMELELQGIIKAIPGGRYKILK